MLTGALSVIAADGYACATDPFYRCRGARERDCRAGAGPNAHRKWRLGSALPPSGTESRPGLLHMIVPAAGRALDTASSAGSIAVPLLAGALGLAAAATLFRPRARRFFR